MIKKLLFFWLYIFSVMVFSQETKSLEEIYKIKGDSTLQAEKEIDTILQNKNTDFVKKRSFDTDLKNKYSSKEFVYVDDIKEKKVDPETGSIPVNSGFFKWFGSFMSTVFPFLLGLIIVLIILKTFLGSETNFWNFKKDTEKLISEEEDIDEMDIDKLLANAIKNKAYRLATRYYYLSLLKSLTHQKHIAYHKDKTNSEYVFEIENKEIRKQFSYLSYIYSYVWYGEFSVDEGKFEIIESKYQSFFKTIL